MCMYAPPGCGGCDVLLACFDPAHRIALIRPGTPGDGWPPHLPAIRRRTGEPYRNAAARLAGAMAPPGALRFGKVTGRIPAAGHQGAVQQGVERRLFTAHVPAPGDLQTPWDGAQLLWSPYGEAVGQIANLAIADFDVFLALRGGLDP